MRGRALIQSAAEYARSGEENYPAAVPLDNAVTSDGRDLYVLNRGGSDLVEFSVGRDAQLTAVGTQALPAGDAGVAAS